MATAKLSPAHAPTTYDTFAIGISSPPSPPSTASVPDASALVLLFIAMPRLAIQMAWAAQWATLGPYMATMLSPTAVQVVQLVGPISGIIVSPVVGIFSDRCTSKWGRRRPFLVYGALATVICWVVMAYTVEIGQAMGDSAANLDTIGTTGGDQTYYRPWTAFITVTCYFWMDVSVSIIQTPIFLLISDFAGNRQTLGAVMGQGWATLGSILVAGYIYVFGAVYLSLKLFLFLISATMIITVTIACSIANEILINQKQINQDSESTWMLVATVLGSFFKCMRSLPKQLAVFIFVFFCVMFGYTAYNGNKGQFFGVEVFGGDGKDADFCGSGCTDAQNAYNHGVQVAGGTTDLLYNIVSCVYAWILPILVQKFGAKWVLVSALVPQALLMAMAFCKVVTIDVIVVIITSVSQVTVMALMVPVIIHVVEDKEDIGVYVGALHAVNCLGMLVDFLIGAAIINTVLGYKLPVFIGGAITFIGLVVGAICFKIKMYSM